MPITADDFVWEATGHTSGSASVVVTHPDAGGTTAGNTVLVFLVSIGASSFTEPSGWIRDIGSSASGRWVYRLTSVGAGVTSWTFTRNAAGDTAWYMVEVSGLALEPFDVSSGGALSTTANGATRSTLTTTTNAASSGVAFAVFGAVKAGSGDVQSWSGYTNSFTERADFTPAGVAGQQIAVATRFTEGWSTWESTATFATSAGVAPSASSGIILYLSADATINAPLIFLTGFEFGTHGGMDNANVAAGSSGNPLGINSGSGGAGTGILVQSSSARNGGYGLRLVASAAARSVEFGLYGGVDRFVTAFNIRPVSATGEATMAYIVASNGVRFELIYDASTEKFGTAWSSVGTVSWQTGTTPLNTWAWVEMRVRASSTTWRADWLIETGTGDGHQTPPADLSAGVTPSTFRLVLGSLLTETFTADYDDLILSRYPAAYPLGPHEVRRLVPETTGATVSGTAANFNQFTNNGTLAAFTTGAGALLDEVPPTVSASSDGVVQVAVGASDYMNFPMANLTLDPNEIIAGVRAVASLWGGTGSGTGTLGFRGHDGTAETTFVAASESFDPDSLTAISGTYPRWYQGMWGVGSAWTQTKLNAAALRVGFSTDATPDMGVSALYLEVATRTIVTSWTVHRLTDNEDPEVDAAVVTETLHPYNSAVRVFTVSNDSPTRTAVFNYTIGGVAQTPVVVAPGAGPTEVSISSDTYGEVDSTSFGWQ
jgi:hypothetical protein